MTQEEFEREMIDLQRYAPPPSDPAALFRLQCRIYDLEQENKELKNALATVQAAQDAALEESFEPTADPSRERTID